jgi:quinol monooxygenase YgiN
MEPAPPIPVHGMDGCVILVEFDIEPMDVAAFLALLRENARQSVTFEAGCRRFDVLTPAADDPSRIVLYEIYDHRSAFDYHLATQHFVEFDEATRSMVRSKKVAEYRLTETAK